MMSKPNSDNTVNGSQDKKSLAVKPFSSGVASTNSYVNIAAADCGQGQSGQGQGPARPAAALVVPNLRSGVTLFGPAAALSSSNMGSAVKFELGGKEMLQQRFITEMSQQMAASPGVNKGEHLSMTFMPPLASFVSQANEIPVPDAALLAHAVEGPSVMEKLENAQKEIAMLQSQLEVQLQVNSEIKRLLVASVGEDFERKVENLARDRAELAMELGGFTRRMTEDYEHLDQISIQADMWRSKYLASRVMVEELAAARAFYSSQFQDSQQVVQELLNERYELRSNLLQSYKCLQQVKEAFDPFNARKSHCLNSTSVLDLASSIKQLSEAVRFRLLPAHAGSHIIMPLEETWESSMTRAELLAYEQLTKQAIPPSFKHTMPSITAAVNILTTSKSFERFHPLTRHDNLTVNCCAHCKGEITVA